MNDDDVHFYAEWHGVRYGLGTIKSNARTGTFIQHLTEEQMQIDSMPVGHVLFEVEFQPILYRREGDSLDIPMREHLYVRGRALPPSDYIVLTDEKLKDFKEES